MTLTNIVVSIVPWDLMIRTILKAQVKPKKSNKVMLKSQRTLKITLVRLKSRKLKT